MSFGAPENDHQEAKAVSRRTLVKGAAWAVPVIAFAAPVPAFAASRCVPSTSLDSLAEGTSPTQIAFFPAANPPVTAGLAYSKSSNPVDTGATGQVATTSTMPPWNYLELEMERNNNDRPLTAGDWVQLTITMSEPVTGLSFIIHDIDSTSSGWRDYINVRTPGYSVNLGNPTNLQGTGSEADPIRPIQNGDLPISSGENAVRLTWNGVVQVVVIRYIAGMTGNSANQHVGLGNLSYQACVPPTSRSARSAAPQATQAFITALPSGSALVESDGSVDQ